MRNLIQNSVLALLLLAGFFANAQNYNMQNGSVNTCTGNFFDSGGNGGSYSNGEDFTATICSDTPGQNIQVVFSSFSTESCCDYLRIYDGPTTGSPLIGQYQGTTSPGTVQASGSCLTFVFHSDGSIVSSGWAATISCFTPAAATCSDGIQNQGETGIDCGGPCPACTNFNMSSTSLSLCSGTWYDPQGTSNYTNSQDITQTICSDTPGQNIQVIFSSFSTESCCDYLQIYDGPSTASPMIGQYQGSTSPGTVQASGSCLTFVFHSDGSVVYSGWIATISCFTPAAATCSDGIQNQGETGIDCGGPCPACTNFNMSSTALNLCSGTWYDPQGTSDYTNSQDITQTICSDTPGQCVTVNFSSFSTESCCDYLQIYDGPNTGSPLIGQFQGTTSPGTVTSSSGCLTFVFHSDGSVVYPGWVATISCAACPTCTDGIQNGLEAGVDCGGPSCPPCPCNVLAVPNDEPCCAITAPVNTSVNCTSTISGATAGATSSMTGCAGTANDDVWFSFTALDPNQDISISNATGTTDLVHELFSGPCTSLTSLGCSDPNTSSWTGLTIGQTYFVRVYTYSSSGSNTGFDLCITSPCGVGGSAPTCGLNYSHSNIGYNPANYNQGTSLTFSDDRFADNYTPIGFDFCFDGVTYQDVLVSSNGYLIFPGCYSAAPGTTTVAPAAYSAWSISAAIPNTTDAPRNAILGPWQDIDPGVSGTIRTQTIGTAPNRVFVAKFDDIAMFSCNSMLFAGQIMLYETTNDIEIHIGEKTICSSWNSGAAILGLHDYTGTTAVVPGGYNYPTQWSVPTSSPEAHLFTCNCNCTTVLPVELVDFKGQSENGYNLLSWKTVSEINNDYFVLEASKGGDEFFAIAQVDGHGTTESEHSYGFRHDNPGDFKYYRLRQVDLDGKMSYSKVIYLNTNEVKSRIYPNPTTNVVYVDLTDLARSYEDIYIATITDVSGKTWRVELNGSAGSYIHKLNEFATFDPGVYIIKVEDASGEMVIQEKIIKK